MTTPQTSVRDLGEVLRDEMVMRDKIIAVLQEGPKTIPDIAEALGNPTQEVVYWVMGMRRYGLVKEKGRPNDEGYFSYELVEEDNS